jgi:hypothetical protein
MKITSYRGWSSAPRVATSSETFSASLRHGTSIEKVKACELTARGRTIVMALKIAMLNKNALMTTDKLRRADISTSCD